MVTVIVFGPTGNIGAVTALTAQAHGAKVFLAMRDTSKKIRGLTSDLENSGGFERVQADLTDPESVATAVKTAKATRAFIYNAHGTPDHMKSTLTAMKSAGIEFVVFLSSFTIPGEPEDVEPKDLISYIHAQGELSLDQVFGREHYVAVRPGAFATNMLRSKAGIVAGRAELYKPEWATDMITPSDMGRVSGTILVSGPKNGQQRVYLYGPHLVSQRKAVEIIGQELGKKIDVKEIDADAHLSNLVGIGLPKPLAEYLISVTGNHSIEYTKYDEGVENVQLYTGKPSMGFEEWVHGNEDLWSA